MKKLIIFTALLCLTASEAEARRMAVIFDAVLTPDCAPWDGPAMSMNIRFNGSGENFRAMIWRHGLEDLTAGKAVSFNLEANEGMDGVGHAYLCPSDTDKSCPAAKATVQLPPQSQWNDTGSLGQLHIIMPSGNEMFYPLRVHLKEMHALCG